MEELDDIDDFDVMMSDWDLLEEELKELTEEEREELENQWTLRTIEQEVTKDIKKIKKLSVDGIKIYKTISYEEYWTIWNYYSIKKGIRLPWTDAVDTFKPVFIIDIPSYKVCVYESKETRELQDILTNIITFIKGE